MEKSRTAEKYSYIKKREEGSEEKVRSKIIGMLIVWIAGIICVPIMKKLEPESYKAYAIYVLAVDVIFTAFVALCV